MIEENKNCLKKNDGPSVGAVIGNSFKTSVVKKWCQKRGVKKSGVPDIGGD